MKNAFVNFAAGFRGKTAFAPPIAPPPASLAGRIAAPLAVVFLALVLAGCPGPSARVVGEGEGDLMGTVRIAVDTRGVGRTIMPDISLADFASFGLHFYRDGQGIPVPLIVDPATGSGSAEANLPLGDWLMTVTGYLPGAGGAYLAAAIYSRLVTVSPGQNDLGTATLAPVRVGDVTGTFAWALGFPPGYVDEAEIRLYRFSAGVIGDLYRALPIDPATGAGSEAVSVGDYLAVFRFAGPNGEMVFSMILQVYMNMTSRFPRGDGVYDIDPAHFLLWPAGVLSFYLELPPPSAPRAIMPESWPTDLSGIDLLFSLADGGRHLTRRLPGAGGHWVVLPPGAWNMAATAFFDAPDGERVPMATGALTGIPIATGETFTPPAPVLLRPIIAGGYLGTFIWDFSFPAAVDLAIMTIAPWGAAGGTDVAPDGYVLYLVGDPTPGAEAAGLTGARDLPSGEYLLSLALTLADGGEVFWSEILRVYANMTSAAVRDFAEGD